MRRPTVARHDKRRAERQAAGDAHHRVDDPDRDRLAAELHDEGCGWNCPGHGFMQPVVDRKYGRLADTALRALAGRLLPPGGEVSEWACDTLMPDGEVVTRWIIRWHLADGTTITWGMPDQTYARGMLARPPRRAVRGELIACEQRTAERVVAEVRQP